MPVTEKIGNVLMGLSLFFWAIMGVFHGLEQQELGWVRIETTLLNLIIGGLIILRRPLILNGNVKSVLLSLPSLVSGGVLFKLSLPFSDWNAMAVWIFSVGCIIAIAAFLNLGKNFAILPGARNVTGNGLYMLVRHPGYFGEFIMCTGCLIASFSIWSALFLVVFTIGLFLRIHQEEKLLMTADIGYESYMKTTKWRLIPWIW